MHKHAITLATLLAVGCAAEVDATTDDGEAPEVAVNEEELIVDHFWLGDDSSCPTASAHRTVQTVGGDIGGIDQEFGASVGTGSIGRTGCDGAFIVDYLMPPRGDNNNPGWTGAWMHAAWTRDVREAITTKELCEATWHTQKVYAYWTYKGVPRRKLLGTFSTVGEWNRFGCEMGVGEPPDFWISSSYEKIRYVSQMGFLWVSGLGQYAYMVTHWW